MPPPVALVLTVAFIGYVLRRESREHPRVSAAVWIPILWLMINGSRQISQWFGSGTTLALQRMEEGSTIDKIVYGGLIAAGVCILVSRRVSVISVVRNNIWLVLLLVYEGISFVWSDSPLISLKRWTKALGDPVMVMVLCTDAAPARAIVSSLKRCAYVLIPLSVLFCKYYENWGRTFDGWGKGSYTGVTLDKNMFGYLLFTFGLLFLAILINGIDRVRDDRTRVRTDVAITTLMLLMIWWLLAIANSSTAFVALVVGTIVMLALRIATVRRHLGFWAVVVLLIGAAFETLFSLSGAIAEAAGREATFTGRTGLWEMVLQEPVNPLIGTGYSSFWLGDRLQRFWAMYPTSPPIQAHNGYLEVYLNLGLIGVGLLAGVLWAGFRRIGNRMAVLRPTSDSRHERIMATFAVSFGVAYLLYNVTEATFHGMNFLFTVFLILAWRGPDRAAQKQPISKPAGTAHRRAAAAPTRGHRLNRQRRVYLSR